jgi:hypothetical protein
LDDVGRATSSAAAKPLVCEMLRADGSKAFVPFVLVGLQPIARLQ